MSSLPLAPGEKGGLQVVIGLSGVHLYSGLLESILSSKGCPTRRTFVFWTAGIDSGQCGWPTWRTLVFWTAGTGLAGGGWTTWRTLVLWCAGTGSGNWGLAYLAYTSTLVCWHRFWQVEQWPTWRTLVLWSAGTGSGRWGLAYLAYTCTLVCWKRFWQVGAV
jgi:hypothetical protein